MPELSELLPAPETVGVHVVRFGRLIGEKIYKINVMDQMTDPIGADMLWLLRATIPDRCEWSVASRFCTRYYPVP